MYDLAVAHVVWPVPSRFRTCSVSEWSVRGRVDYPEEWEQIKEWLTNFPRYLKLGQGMVLTGPAGTGKTMLASASLNYLYGHGFSVAYVRDGDLMHLLSPRYPSETETELLAYLQRSACVVVDDLGRTRAAPEEIEPFLRYRMDEGKPTLITMNNEVALSATLYSFLHEFVYVTLAGEDRRIHPLERADGEW